MEATRQPADRAAQPDELVLTTALVLAPFLVDGFFRRDLYGLSPSLYWAFDFLKFVAIPAVGAMFLARAFGVRPKDYGIGGVARTGTLLMVRNEARDRLTNRSAKPVVVGDTDGIRSWVAMTVWAAEYLDWNLRWIYGYPGSRELQLAIRQGEIDIWATANVKLVKDLQREGVVQIVLAEDERRREDYPDVPTFLETLGAKKPTGLAWQAFLGWAGSPDLDKFIVAPPGTPDPLVKSLRDAFAKVMKDPEVDKEGDKFFGDGWKPITPERVDTVIHDQTSISKEAKDFIAKLRRKYNLPVGETKS